MYTEHTKYWPGRSRGRWRRQSRSRQSHFHTHFPQFLRACRRGGCSGTPTWSRATPRPWRFWGANASKLKWALLLISRRRPKEFLEYNVGNLKRRVKAWKKVWKLLWRCIALSSISSMFPNTWGSRRAGGSQRTTIATDRLHRYNEPPQHSRSSCLQAILRSHRVCTYVFRKHDPLYIKGLGNRAIGNPLRFILDHYILQCHLNTRDQVLVSLGQWFWTAGGRGEDTRHNCWYPTVSPKLRCGFKYSFAPQHVHPARLTDHCGHLWQLACRECHLFSGDRIE